MKRKKYSCDFETTTDVNDCRVWAYGYMEIGNKKNFKIGTSMDEFMGWVLDCDSDLYFHNLKFDGSFIVNWLEHHGMKYDAEGNPNTYKTSISSMGQWYKIDICIGYKGKRKIHTVIYDSLKKLPFKVKEIAKGFKLPIAKGDIDYHKKRPVGYVLTKDEIAYIINDIEIVADALEVQLKQGLDRMTTGSDALSGYKSIITRKKFDKLFPVFSNKLDDKIRKAYKGGFTWLNEKYKEKDIGTGIVFDVNSLYPSVMYQKDLPYGMPVEFMGEYEHDEDYPLYVMHVRCEFILKEDHIPTIQIKKNSLRFRPNEYLESSDGEIVDLYVTNVDWELIQDHYNLYDVEYVQGWKFRSAKGLFKNFIEKWTYVKVTEDGAKKILAKLMLNSLYGKFASNPDNTGKVPYLKEDGSLGFRAGEKDIGDPIYTPMGAFITAYARELTIRTAQKCFDRIIYCDTDSIHLTGEETPDAIKDIVHPKSLGFWAYEYTFKRARYIRQKTYLNDVYGKMVVRDGEEVFEPCLPEESTLTKITVKCAGMTDSVKEDVTWDNFRVGLTVEGKKLKPKQVKGGVVLVETPFTLKG